MSVTSTLLRSLKRTSDRNRILILAVPATLIGLLSVFGLFTHHPQEMGQVDTTSERDLILASTPIAISGISSEDNAVIAAAKLQEAILLYEKALSEVMTEETAKLITVEANRLLREARKEAETGLLYNTDPYGLDLTECIKHLDRVRCVLLRYAGEGIESIAEGTKAGDVYRVSNGRIRYHAALLALYPPPQFQAEAPVAALHTYRNAVADIIPLLPSARIATELGAEDNQISPGTNLQRNNPLPATPTVEAAP